MTANKVTAVIATAIQDSLTEERAVENTWTLREGGRCYSDGTANENTYRKRNKMSRVQ